MARRFSLPKLFLLSAALIWETAGADSGFDDNYQAFQGDANNDGLTDILVHKPAKIVILAGEINIPIAVRNGVDDFILQQNSDGSFQIISDLSPAQASMNQWSPTSIVVSPVDMNLDAIVDGALSGIGEVITGADDLVVFAQPGVGTAPKYIGVFDENMQQFSEQVYSWIINRSFFDDLAHTTEEIDGWYFMDYLLWIGLRFNGTPLSGNPYDPNTEPGVCQYTGCVFDYYYNTWLIYLYGTYVYYDYGKPSINQAALGFANSYSAGDTIPRPAPRPRAPGWWGWIPTIVEALLDELLDRPDWPAQASEDIGLDESVVQEVLTVLNVICRSTSEEPNSDGESPADTCMERAADIIGEGTANGGIEFPTDVVNHDKFDMDALARWVPTIAVIEAARKRSTNRRHCTYEKSHPAGLVYYGRTTARPGESCFSALQRRDAAHNRGRLAGFGSAMLDTESIGIVGYPIMRGREQQLIDQHVYDVPQPWTSSTHGLDDPSVANLIRGVARRNPAGCLFWAASTTAKGEKGPYTGHRTSPVLSCGSIPTFPP